MSNFLKTTMSNTRLPSLNGLNALSVPVKKLLEPILDEIKAIEAKRVQRPPPKPLLNIEDVRAFIRSKIGPPKPSTIHGDHRRVSSGVFGIGTMGSTSLEGGYVPLSSHSHEPQGEISSIPPPIHGNHDQSYQDNGNGSENANDYAHNNNPEQYPSPLLDLEDVREFVQNVLHYTGFHRRPPTSWRNKMPWHVPRAPFLAKGLEWPPDSFESEEQKREFYMKARKRKPFLMGTPPLWTVIAFNFVFIKLLMYNPVRKFLMFLKTIL